MKLLDGFLLGISLVWFVINIALIIVAISDKRVKSIEINWRFFIPVLIWLFIAYRIGG